MKIKIVALVGGVIPGKKKQGSAMRRAVVAYPDGQTGIHMIYAEDGNRVHALQVGAVVDLDVRMEEFASLQAA